MSTYPAVPDQLMGMKLYKPSGVYYFRVCPDSFDLN
jgi:hypothetical protein